MCSSGVHGSVIRETLEGVQMCYCMLEIVQFSFALLKLCKMCKMCSSGVRSCAAAAVSSVPAGGDLGDPEYKVARQRSSSLS